MGLSLESSKDMVIGRSPGYLMMCGWTFDDIADGRSP